MRDDEDEFSEFEELEEEVEISPETLELLEQEYEFERSFYIGVCGTEQFEIVPIPDESGYIASPNELKLIQAEGLRQGLKILYRISHGTFATVFDPDTGKIGLMPNRQNKGFAC